MENDALPQYMRIARSIAQRIADGELMEGEKLSGRSKLSSEYNVSPETIRKAVQVLQDRAVVIVREQSGVYVLSAELARQCLAPIAGLVFTLEVLMIDLTMSSLLPLLISAVTAATVSYIVTGTEAMFKFHLDQAFELERIPFVILLGIFCGLISL